MRTVEVTLKLVFEVAEADIERLPQLHTRVEEQLQGSDFMKKLWKLGTVHDAQVTLVEEHNVLYVAD